MRLVLLIEITVYSENHANPINELFGQNV